MFDLFGPPHRRVRDEREIRYFFSKYGADTLTVLNDRANDTGLRARDRRHWRRLARKAQRQQGGGRHSLKSP